MKKLLYLIIPLLLTGCSREFVEKIYHVNYEPTSRFAAHNLAPKPGQFEKDTDALDSLINSFTGDIAKKWGRNQVKVAGKSNYVKYIDNYESRSEVNFATGKILIETVASKDAKAHLKKAIITTLLTPEDPANVDLFSSSSIKLGGEPFLYKQVVDQDGKAIQWNWRANRFAEYLIENKMKTHKVDFKLAHYVEIPMVVSHGSVRSYKYANIVRRASQKYDIPEDLIYAIIKTESSFNPYAVSWANAYGLMQVVPKTAGADVFKLMKNRSGTPSPEYLFNPENNIDTGVAYFHILKTRYLKDVRNSVSREYSMISAYNGGTGGVLNTFDRHSRSNALSRINNLQPNQVYWALTHKHRNAESRRYLEKVTAHKREFNQSKG
ncbi:membrane-bound lytic murein transglycosylase MltC [Vibrio gallicus]|uniref:membrane-bound lytic murein transglycosylase MltC n=1 Tax=Vibrio gallicus TaxID=190897 RepID=UPI0021C3F9E5|nr:membrane-bound lytic murein transglycosylase MltC [Vibrio gallicus]